MIKHIDTWFTFARGLGLGIEQMEEIVLVTGLHFTRSWANVTFFEGQMRGQASLGVNVTNGPNTSINWRCLPGSVRGGVRSWGPEGEVCQFARDPGIRSANLWPEFRTYRRINAYSYEVSVLLVSSGYCIGGLEAPQDPTRYRMGNLMIMSLTRNSSPYPRWKR